MIARFSPEFTGLSTISTALTILSPSPNFSRISTYRNTLPKHGLCFSAKGVACVDFGGRSWGDWRDRLVELQNIRESVSSSHSTLNGEDIP